MNKKYLENMSDNELSIIWKNNRDIRTQVFDICLNNEYDFINNEIYSDFRYYDNLHGREKWSIDIHESSQCFYITVDPVNYEDFLIGCLKVAHDIASDFSDDHITLINRLLKKVVFFRDCIEGYIDISDSRFNSLENWIESGVKKLIKALENTIKLYVEAPYEDNYCFSYFSDAVYLEDSGLYILNDDYTKVYADIQKCYV